MVEIAEVDVSDLSALREFHDAACAGLSSDRPYAVLASFESRARLAGTPSSFYRRELLVAREAGRVVGTAQLGLHLSENTHLADLEVVVVAEARRRGVGRALHDEALRRGRAAGRTTYLGAVFQPDAETPAPATAFAAALGYELVELDHHVVLELPVPTVGPAAVADGYEVLGWQDRTPADLVEEYAALQTQMARDLPSDGIDREPFETTVEELREMEARAARVGTRLVAVARLVDDRTLVGYSVTDLEHGSTDVAQLDTMVLPEHRGRGLGLSMKAAILRTIVRGHPDRRRVHSWNAVGNGPIRRINDALGFRTVEVAWQVQRRDPDA